MFFAEFDIALIADNSDRNARGRVSVATLDGKKKATQSSSVHRIKFFTPDFIRGFQVRAMSA